MDFLRFAWAVKEGCGQRVHLHFLLRYTVCVGRNPKWCTAPKLCLRPALQSYSAVRRYRYRCRPFFVDAVSGCNYDEYEICARLVVPAATRRSEERCVGKE